MRVALIYAKVMFRFDLLLMPLSRKRNGKALPLAGDK
jgi:hypothetical protein